MKKLRYLICILASLLTLNVVVPAYAAKKVGLTATASSAYSSSFAAAKAVDKSPLTYWRGADKAAPWWIMVDAGAVTDLSEIRIGWWWTNCATKFDIQVSQDGSTWEEVYTDVAGAYFIYQSFELDKKARYVKIYIDAARSEGPRIFEIEVYTYNFNPRKIRFQGTLKDSKGTNVDGVYDLSFRIYDIESSGLPLWNEAQQDILVEDGMLDVVLGKINEVNLPFDKQYYLGVEVESDGEMAPRFEITGVPYAFSSER